jgi:hypothetical protein
MRLDWVFVDDDDDDDDDVVVVVVVVVVAVIPMKCSMFCATLSWVPLTSLPS